MISFPSISPSNRYDKIFKLLREFIVLDNEELQEFSRLKGVGDFAVETQLFRLVRLLKGS